MRERRFLAERLLPIPSALSTVPFWPNPGRRRLPLVRHPHPSPVLLQSGRSIQVFDLTVMLPSVTWAAVQLAFGHCKTNKLAAHVSGCICVRFRAFPWLTNSFFVV